MEPSSPPDQRGTFFDFLFGNPFRTRRGRLTRGKPEIENLVGLSP